MMRTCSFIFAFLLLVHAATARDERSIKDLSKALAGLARDVDPAEAELVSVTAHTTARKLAKDYRVVSTQSLPCSWSMSACENADGAGIGRRTSARA